MPRIPPPPLPDWPRLNVNATPEERRAAIDRWKKEELEPSMARHKAYFNAVRRDSFIVTMTTIIALAAICTMIFMSLP
jgi:hypothetical protein